MEDKYGYVDLAYEAIRNFIENKQRIEPPLDKEAFNKRAGVFVTIKKDGQLRGCIGTIEPAEDNVAEEIISNAISAATRDPRFRQLKKGELDKINVSVDILGPKEEIDDLQELNPDKYGVIVKKHSRTGLLLPNLEGIDSVKKQIDIACKKAGIYPEEEYSLARFKVDRYEQK
ncbi:MAG: AmmeMemoRadiSam system protein A [Halanaerobiales bacterium]|nr:AmmeMemoRadiSam system protein A [Halanaerobiales bacterium]